MCLKESVLGMPSFDIGVGHGAAYRLIEDNIAHYVSFWHTGACQNVV